MKTTFRCFTHRVKTECAKLPSPSAPPFSAACPGYAKSRCRRLECGDLSPLSRRRLVAVELLRALAHASVSALARTVNAPLHSHASRNSTATSRLDKAVTSPRTPKLRAHPPTAPGVAQTSKSAVSRVSKPADAPIVRNAPTSRTRPECSGPRRFGNRRYSRLGSLRYFVRLQTTVKIAPPFHLPLPHPCPSVIQ